MSDKFLVIGDLHIGVGSDDPWQEDIRRKLMAQVIDYSITNNIKDLIFLGDIFDVRRHITHRTLEFNREILIEPIQNNNLNAYCIIGNHDAAHTNTLTPNAVTEVFGVLDNFHVVESIDTINLGGVDIDLVSWICQDNQIEIFDYIKSSKSKYCFGHFELVGFYYYSGITATSGADPQFLKDYDMVYSGHYHTINGHGNVKYLGTPFTITSNDDNEVRGFWEFDTQDMKNPKLIENPKIWHRRIKYPFPNEMTLEDINIEEYIDTRVILELNAPEDDVFRTLEESLEKVANNIKVRNNYALINSKRTQAMVDDEVKYNGGPLELAYEFIDKNDILSEEDRVEIKRKIESLYMNALNKVGEE